MSEVRPHSASDMSVVVTNSNAALGVYSSSRG
jgi:hypothetical protein